MQGEGHKSFFHFPNPQKSVEDHITCKAWLDNLKNARMQKKKKKEKKKKCKITSGEKINQIIHHQDHYSFMRCL